MTTTDSGPNPPAATDEVVRICQELLRIDSTNTGDNDTSVGERAAAEYVAAQLAEVGIDSFLTESAPGRASLVARIPGADPSRSPLLVHGHLDVVPADPAEWQVHPFSGEVRDGYVWGRGAVDMKDFDAMVLALVRQWRRTGSVPPRDLVLAFFADEEAGSTYGAHHVIEHHAELFEGVTEAIGEVGGYSVSVSDDLRLYLIQTAEKGLNWMRLTARGAPGHGSMVHHDNAVAAMCRAVARISAHEFPVELTPTVRRFLDEVSDAYGVELDPERPEQVIAKLGPMARAIGATVRNTANPTMLSAGYKTNVVPGEAHATVDGRALPGHEDGFLAEIQRLAGADVEIAYEQHQPALETDFNGPLVDAMAESLRHHDAGARPVPYMMFGGTDGKALGRLGIRHFGFAPLKLPADLDFTGLFHGVDERVPVDALRFGVRVLDRFFAHC
ncbi:M20/M25/M40 family metallo-hydrolase [Actinocatenispora comari]|uniref:Peptidase M20 n=1 Tax=Actinocatenispora comari TaxID=2807577 RepID=A0A8J4AI69_9ACTN|nr:M20/M25/M40 family metallo-hydrolase [Actinocatenispora comari]GIL30177.1 peptidase M20 [Actinocatenispora comari]